MSCDLFEALDKVVEDGKVTRISTVALYGAVMMQSSRPDRRTMTLMVTPVGEKLVVDQNIAENEICGLVWFDYVKGFFDMVGWLTRREAEQLGQRVISGGHTYFLVNDLELLHDPETVLGEPDCV